ncbi:MAG: prepilin peptidase [Lachnospiraceae bacterium]|nr:prepilin peptidase [Lachnospiraceae bacterium]
MLKVILLSLFLLTALLCDLRSKRIPDLLSLTVLISSVLFYAVRGELRSLAMGLVAATVIGLAMLPLFMMRAIGGGDLKFCAAFGAWIGIREGFLFLFISLVVAAGMSIVLIAMKKRYIRFAVPMCMAGLIRVVYEVLSGSGIL